MPQREEFGRRSAGSNGIPEGAPAWVVRMIQEAQAQIERGEYRGTSVKPNTVWPTVRAVRGPHPRFEERSEPTVRSQKKKWAGPSAADLEGAKKFFDKQEAAQIAQQQILLNTILS